MLFQWEKCVKHRTVVCSGTLWVTLEITFETLASVNVVVTSGFLLVEGGSASSLANNKCKCHRHILITLACCIVL